MDFELLDVCYCKSKSYVQSYYYCFEVTSNDPKGSLPAHGIYTSLYSQVMLLFTA